MAADAGRSRILAHQMSEEGVAMSNQVGTAAKSPASNGSEER